MSASTLPHNAVVTFSHGLPGFESCRRFVLVQSEDCDPGVCLKGLDDGGPTFFTIDPRLLVPGYTCPLSAADRARLGEGPCVWLVLVSCAGDIPRVNMRAPVVINAATMHGIQVVPAESVWAIDMPWTEVACLS